MPIELKPYTTYDLNEEGTLFCPILLIIRITKKPDGNLRDEELDILFKENVKEGAEIIFEDGMDNPIRHKTLLYVVPIQRKISRIHTSLYQ